MCTNYYLFFLVIDGQGIEGAFASCILHIDGRAENEGLLICYSASVYRDETCNVMGWVWLFLAFSTPLREE